MKNFGTTIKETLDAFKPVHLGEKDQKANNDKLIVIGRIIISIILIISGTVLYVTTAEHKELGIMFMGTVLGYWLK